MAFAFRAKNLGPLKEIDWRIPRGVSVVVGPNGVGKSTLLRLPEFARIAFNERPDAAVTRVFEGTAYLRHHAARLDDPIEFGTSIDDIARDFELQVVGGSVIARWHDWKPPRTAPPNIPPPIPRVEKLHTYQTYRYVIGHIAKFGSQHSAAIALQPDGENVFPLLRNWRDRSELESRYEFVLSTLREAFPHVKRLDFEQAGQTVTVAVVDERYPGKKTPISRESTGFLIALLHLCAIASCPEGGLVTLDELETSLHPRAIKVLIEAFQNWASDHSLSIVLATQSETVLDQFHDEPDKIFVLEPGMAPAPKPLTDLFDRAWLSQFSLGDLFGHLEYGSVRTE